MGRVHRRVHVLHALHIATVHSLHGPMIHSFHSASCHAHAFHSLHRTVIHTLHPFHGAVIHALHALHIRHHFLRLGNDRRRWQRRGRGPRISWMIKTQRWDGYVAGTAATASNPAASRNGLTYIAAILRQSQFSQASERIYRAHSPRGRRLRLKENSRRLKDRGGVKVSRQYGQAARDVTSRGDQRF